MHIEVPLVSLYVGRVHAHSPANNIFFVVCAPTLNTSCIPLLTLLELFVYLASLPSTEVFLLKWSGAC